MTKKQALPGHVFKAHLLQTGCAVCVATALCAPGAAVAQSQPTPDQKAPAGDYSLPEIVVTARKQNESIQSVPIAISALSSEELESRRIFDVAQLGETVSGLVIAGSGRLGFPVIRGVYTAPPDAGADGAVGQYIDEVYQPRIANQLTALLDLERIEVLKGPQGTLFGRNTIAGAVNYVTKRPGETFAAQASLAAGTRGHLEARGSASGPIATNLSAGLAVMARQNDGNIDVVGGDSRRIGDDGSSDWGARASLRWTPSETFELNAALTHITMDSATVFLVDGNPAGTLTPPLVAFGLIEPSPFVADHRNYGVGLTEAGALTRKATQASVRAEWQLGGGVQLTSLTAYQRFSEDNVFDLDLEIQPISTYSIVQDSDTFSQELRLARGEGRLRWNLGANYFVDDHYQSNLIDLTSLPAPFDIGIFDLTDVETKSWAVFGQAYFSLSDKMTLSGGIRYSDDLRNYRKMADVPIPEFGDSFDSALTPGWNTKLHSDAISYTLSLDYRFSPDVMAYASHSKGYRSGGVQGRAISIATASHNYGPETARQYEVGLKSQFYDRRVQLNVAAYQIDYKDIQVSQESAAEFFVETAIRNAGAATMKGIEIDSIVYVTPEFSIDLHYAYNDSKFDRYRSVDDIPAKLASLADVCAPDIFGCAPGDYIFDGVPLQFAPKHSVSIALNYEKTLTSGAKVTLRADYAWKDHYLLASIPTSLYARSGQFLDDNFLRQPAFGVLGLNASLDSADGRWTLALWGRNVEGVRYATVGDDIEPAVTGGAHRFIYGDRRSFGVSMTWRK